MTRLWEPTWGRVVRRSRTATCVALAALLVAACSSNEGSVADGGGVPDTRTAGDAQPTDLAPADGPVDGADTADVAEPGFHALPAVATCPAATPLCDEDAPDENLYGAYRKDFYLPDEQYEEPLDPPLDGGRIQVAAISQVTGTVTGIFLNDEPVPDLLAELKLDWHHVWPEQVVAGQPVWFAGHSRDAAWDSLDSAALRIETDNGVAVEGSFTVAPHPIAITYVTLDDDGTTLLVHVHNGDASDHTLTGFGLNGREVLPDHACVPDPVLQAGRHALWTVPVCEPPTPGSAWTVVLHFDDTEPVVAVGRHLRPFFPIEAWQKGSDCPLPGANDEALDLFLDGGLDTFYFYWGNGTKCGYDNATMYNETLPARGDVFVLLGDDFPWDDPPVDVLLDTSAVAGVLTGDESDWEYVTDDGAPKPEVKATQARKVWRAFPELAVYNGAMTSRHIGAFAGMTDIQGVDVYAAGCAPHILSYEEGVPLRGPYDFLLNARNNHMPWPTWLYSQGLGNWAVCPDPQELLVQGIQVIAAGAKGLMWFQVGQEMIAEFPDSWEAIKQVNWLVRGVRPWLRQGDRNDLARAGDETLTTAIRAREALVVPLITLQAESWPTGESCLYYRLAVEEEEPHWLLSTRTTDLHIDVPQDMTAVDLFELRPEGPVDVTWPVTVTDRTITISGIELDNTTPARLFVVAESPEARTQAAARMATR